MPETIIVNDVGPRDGLQNQQRILPPEDRVRLVRALLDAGMGHVEIAAFVSPKAVPAMAGAADVVQALDDVGDAQLSVLIPNMKGYELATEAGATAVGMVLYATDEMANANVRMTMAEADAATEAIIARAKADGVSVTATISVSFECPFAGRVDPGVVKASAARFLALDVEAYVVADTIGAADPARVRALMDDLVSQHGPDRLACHFHDTRAMGLANVFAAVESGVRRFDASIGGLGGCPFAPGASGNVATEDVVMMLHQMGFDTGIDLRKLLEASDLARTLTGTAPGGRAKPWLDRYLAA